MTTCPTASSVSASGARLNGSSGQSIATGISYLKIGGRLMAECERCGDEVNNKNAAGHYRDKCMSCIKDVAYSPGDADE